LISQEKCLEMISLDKELYPSYCLELQGLNESARQILEAQSLKDKESWSKLIDLYQGNPRYLQLISVFINDIFQNAVQIIHNRTRNFSGNGKI
jgi:hypothetical protein